jgi:Fe-S-cluster-containing hydrogenase component 2
VEVCPTNVFDTGADGLPVIARQHDCQTCYLCEAYCPTDALFVAATTAPHPTMPDQAELAGTGLLGSYRAALGWGRGRRLGARTAVGPPLPHEPPPVVPEAKRRGDP